MNLRTTAQRTNSLRIRIERRNPQQPNEWTVLNYGAGFGGAIELFRGELDEAVAYVNRQSNSSANDFLEGAP